MSIQADITALWLDLAVQSVHTASKRTISLLPSQGKQKKGRGNRKTDSAVKDVLREGRLKLVDQGMFEDWKKRTMSGGMLEDEGGSRDYVEEVEDGGVFGDPNGQLDVDVGMDSEFAECPFSNVDIVNTSGEH